MLQTANWWSVYYCSILLLKLSSIANILAKSALSLKGWEKLTWQGWYLSSQNGKPGNVPVFKGCVNFSLFSCQFWSFDPIVNAIFFKILALYNRRDQKFSFRSISLLENRKVIGIYLFRGGAINTFGLNINLCFWRIFFFVRKPYNTNNEDHRNNRNTDGRRNDESRKTDRNENGNCRGPRTQTRTPYTDNRETDQTDLSDHDDRVLAVINCRDEPKYVNYGTAVCRENETNRENNVQSRNS